MNDIKIISIGRIENKEGDVRIVLGPGYSEGLKGLEGYSHVQILWWADGCDNKCDRGPLVIEKPYTKGPNESGGFDWKAEFNF